MLFRGLIFIIVSFVILFYLSVPLSLITVGGVLPFVCIAVCLGVYLRELAKLI